MALTNTTLAEAVDADALTFTVVNAAGASLGGFIRVDDEYSFITGILGKNIAVRGRGSFGGLAVDHAAGAPVVFGLAADVPDGGGTGTTGSFNPVASITVINGRVTEATEGPPGGFAQLGPDGKILPSELPIEIWSYQGDWDVATNDPSLTDGIGTVGHAYLVSTAGTRDTGHGNIVWNVGDAAVYDGTQWDQIPHGGQLFVQIGGQSAASMLVVGTTTAQAFRIITNNVPRITVSSIGNVGIGVDTPTVPLHVAGAMAVQAGSVQTSWDPTSGTVLQLGTLSNHAVNLATNNVTRATIAPNGDLQMAAGYTPANPRSVATKEYVDATAAAATVGTTYVPTVTPGTNVASATANGAFIYTKVGTSIQVAGSMDVTATATGAAVIQITLPIPVTFADTHKLSGSGAATNGTVMSPAYLRSTASAQTATIDWIAPNTQANTLRFTAMYTTTP